MNLICDAEHVYYYFLLLLIFLLHAYMYYFGCSVLLCIGSSPGDNIYKEWEVVSAWGKGGGGVS